MLLFLCLHSYIFQPQAAPVTQRLTHLKASQTPEGVSLILSH